jgi:hypothetical protein
VVGEGIAVEIGTDRRLKRFRVRDVRRNPVVELIIDTGATGEFVVLLGRFCSIDQIFGIGIHRILATTDREQPAIEADLILHVEAGLRLDLIGVVGVGRYHDRAAVDWSSSVESPVPAGLSIAPMPASATRRSATNRSACSGQRPSICAVRDDSNPVRGRLLTIRHDERTWKDLPLSSMRWQRYATTSKRNSLAGNVLRAADPTRCITALIHG